MVAPVDSADALSLLVVRGASFDVSGRSVPCPRHLVSLLRRAVALRRRLLPRLRRRGTAKPIFSAASPTRRAVLARSLISVTFLGRQLRVTRLIPIGGGLIAGCGSLRAIGACLIVVRGGLLEVRERLLPIGLGLVSDR